MKRLLLFCLIIFMTVSLIACGNRMEEYTSPSGANRIKVEYDYASRPSVFYALRANTRDFSHEIQPALSFYIDFLKNRGIF